MGLVLKLRTQSHLRPFSVKPRYLGLGWPGVLLAVALTGLETERQSPLPDASLAPPPPPPNPWVLSAASGPGAPLWTGDFGV